VVEQQPSDAVDDGLIDTVAVVGEPAWSDAGSNVDITKG
jgi:hypothetical protein